MSSTELVSLSTDNTCKLWSVGSNKTFERTFKAHSNVHRFVGLATNDEYICCGSENNALYIYYKGFSKPVLTYSFDFDRPISRTGIESHWSKKNITQNAITAVCWKKDSNVILAGNTEGSVKVLEAI
ncbi:E3 ubiquitin-protein ligase COP1-like [Tetranychus urticae]|nr:E3 ubiquitin-protein ligase COP1-like [Tetranychus urticae]